MNASKIIVADNFLNQDPNALLLDCSIDSVNKKEAYSTSSFTKFDLKNTFSNSLSKYDNMLPPISQFVEGLENLGIDSETTLILVDNKGLYSSPRVYFMLKSIKHSNVFIYTQNLDKINSQPNSRTKSIYSLSEDVKHFSFFCDKEYVLAKLTTSIIIDVRSKERFNGTAKEPRPNLKSGHIPLSRNIPYTNFLDNGNLQTQNHILNLLEGIDKSEELIFTCGSGVTACIGALAAFYAGFTNIKIYDGSWSEWGDPENNLPISK